MVIYFPKEIKKIIFSFQEKWWWFANSNRFISVQKLLQIPRPRLNRYQSIFVATFKIWLPISSFKSYCRTYVAFGRSCNESLFLVDVYVTKYPESWYSDYITEYIVSRHSSGNHSFWTNETLINI